ncbi:MAG: DUF998 domain-containing protein, partial [Promethearchaeota archaeon]
QGYVDITKAMIGSMIGMIHKYKNKIFTWYVENRTAHSKSQYSMWVCGIAPIGFYPNKDVFLGKVESDLMQICYDERALIDFRTSEIPKILPPVENCFLYSDSRFDLGEYYIQVPSISLDKKKILNLKKHLKKHIERDKFGYETIRFSFPDNDSYFEFLYTPQVQNFEKAKYRVNSLEELYVFVKRFITCGKELGIRYCEAFISAYEPTHQKIFYDLGLTPRGYVPSWKYNTERGVFEDNILFNWFDGTINKEIRLIDEGKELLNILSLGNVERVKEVFEKRRLVGRLPLFYTFKEKLSQVWNYPKVIKSSLMTGLMVYLLMLIGSVVIANIFGYNIISNTISQLGATRITPAPFMFNCACVIGGLTTSLLYCYLSRRIQIIKNNKVINAMLRFGTILGINGSIGIMFVGIFSMDRSGPLGVLHNLSSIYAFGGYIIALLIFGIIIFRSYSKMPRIIGINGMIPLTILIGYFIFPSPLLEWIILITIITSLIPLFYWVSFR